MSDMQVGKYIRLLCFQHQHGHMTEKDMLKICKRYEEDIFCKFRKDGDGLYFNERLDSEITKRALYSESRRKNREKKVEDMKNICSTHDEHMENENINRDITPVNKETSKSFIPPTIEEVQAYCRERCNSVVAQVWHDFYSAKGWMIGKNKMKDWKAAVRTWEKNDVQGTGYRRFGDAD
jgi:hypothetical protein